MGGIRSHALPLGSLLCRGTQEVLSSQRAQGITLLGQGGSLNINASSRKSLRCTLLRHAAARQ